MLGTGLTFVCLLYTSDAADDTPCVDLGGRRRSYMTHEEEEDFLKEQLSSSLNGEFVTVNSLFKDYQERVGHKTTREGFYALLKRHGWVKESRDSLRWEIKLTK